MALDKDILGQALHDARQSFNDQTLTVLLETYGTLDGIRLAAAKADAEAIINHFKNNAIILPGSFANTSGSVEGEGSIE